MCNITSDGTDKTCKYLTINKAKVSMLYLLKHNQLVSCVSKAAVTDLLNKHNVETTLFLFLQHGKQCSLAADRTCSWYCTQRVHNAAHQTHLSVFLFTFKPLTKHMQNALLNIQHQLILPNKSLTKELLSTKLKNKTYLLLCIKYVFNMNILNFTFSALTLLVGWQEGHLACKKTGCWFVGSDDLTGALHGL